MQGRRQDAVTREDYFQTLSIYTHSQHRKLDDGRIVPWIDENLNPLTGVRQARAMKIRNGTFYDRGDHYNHSGYCDLVISGLVGLRPPPDNIVELNPLLPTGKWDWFCLDNVRYHGRILTVVWDRTGTEFGEGKGLSLFADGIEIGRRSDLAGLTGKLS